jgi:hypothetical protein
MLRTAAEAALVLVLLLAVIVGAGVLWPSSNAPLPHFDRRFVLNNVRVVDVEAGTASALVSVTVADGKIAAIGVPAPSSLPAVDGGGGFLVPGFWDMHMHSFKMSPQLHLPLFLANGITGVRDMMGCPGDEDSLIACAGQKRSWSADAAAGRLASPRFVSLASYYFENPALTEAEVQQRAATYAGQGVDELKVYNRLPRQTFFQLAGEARRLKLRLVGHLPKAVALPEALAAGQKSFEHAHVLVRHCSGRAADWRSGKLDGQSPTGVARLLVSSHDPAICQSAFASMRVAGAWLVPTHVTREEDARAADPSFINDERLHYLDPLSRWAFRDDLAATRSAYPAEEGRKVLAAYFDGGLKLTRAAHRAGVPILVGTDTAIGGFRYHDELSLLVRAGLSPAEALRAATIDAARYLGMERSFGTVAVGKQADLVLLGANPLQHISGTRRIKAVILAGRFYDRDALDRLLVFTKRQAGRPDNWIKLLWGFAWSSVASDL